ncbi:MAG: hypothetical protein OEL89_01105 [Candidatus Peregrinibacteria bacterium]|nr:hypothetical protein [Candidatus Peregrinibacteria bacterium]
MKKKLPLIILATGLVFFILMLTNNFSAPFFSMRLFGTLYANMWENLLNWNFTIDPKYCHSECFINFEKKAFIAYFGLMPAFFRGLFAPFLDIYKVGLSNLGMVLGFIISFSFLTGTLKKLGLLKNKLGYFLLVALVFSSPITFLFTWGWIYHEVILWGFVWTMISLSIFLSWTLGKKREQNLLNGTLLGLAVGLAVLSRPSSALTVLIPYAILCAISFTEFLKTKKGSFKKLLPGTVLALFCAFLVIAGNVEKWGEPFTFVRMDRHVQLMKNVRGEAIVEHGHSNLNRVPHALLYYFVPSGDNFKAEFPFVRLDEKLDIMNSAPHFDYIEGSRLPMILSSLYLFVFGILGLWHFRKLPKKGWLGTVLVGGTFTLITLSSIYCVALRYSADLTAFLIFANILFLLAVKEKKVKLPKYLPQILIIFSILLSVAMVLVYKSWVWDVPPKTRLNIMNFFNEKVEEGKYKFMINGEKLKTF